MIQQSEPPRQSRRFHQLNNSQLPSDIQNTSVEYQAITKTRRAGIQQPMHSYQQTLMHQFDANSPQKDQNQHLSHLAQPIPLKPSSKREEVWSSARKIDIKLNQNDLLLKVSNDLNPRRVTEMGDGLHSKYFALNNSFLDNKGPRQQVVNPITHEVTFSGKDLIAKQSASSGLNVFGLRNLNIQSATSNI